MHRKGIPVYPTPERGIRALAQVIPGNMKGKKAAFTHPAPAGRSQMSVNESFEFLDAKGFECIFSRPADSQGKAVNLAHKMGFPVALKINSPDILHKSDCGGVRLNIQTAQQLRNAYVKMMHDVGAACPGARLPGTVVSAMAAPGLELLLGMTRDPQFGPIIMFGLGGLPWNSSGTLPCGSCPSRARTPSRCSTKSRGPSSSRDFAAAPAIDREALADGLLRLAAIAREHPDIVEIDLNPVMAYPEGMVVVDARIIKA